MIIGYRQNGIVIFGDSISGRIRVRNFNKELDTDHVKIKIFPGEEFPHYVTPTSEDGNFDVAILDFELNYVLQSFSKAADDLILKLKKTAKKFMSFGVIKMIALDMVFNIRVDNSFVDKAKSKIISMCNPTMESGMRILAQNFNLQIRLFFMDAFTPSRRTFSTKGVVTYKKFSV